MGKAAYSSVLHCHCHCLTWLLGIDLKWLRKVVASGGCVMVEVEVESGAAQAVKGNDCPCSRIIMTKMCVYIEGTKGSGEAV